MNYSFEIKGIFYNKYIEVPFTGKIYDKTTGSFKNGKRDGSWLDYWESGKLQSKTNHKNGILEGSWVSYFGNGQLSSTRNYKDGILINN